MLEICLYSVSKFQQESSVTEKVLIIYQKHLFKLMPRSISKLPKILNIWKWKRSRDHAFLFLFPLTCWKHLGHLELLEHFRRGKGKIKIKEIFWKCWVIMISMQSHCDVLCLVTCLTRNKFLYKSGEIINFRQIESWCESLFVKLMIKEL